MDFYFNAVFNELDLHVCTTMDVILDPNYAF